MLGKLIFGGAAAIVAYLVADKVVTETTGQHIHQHIFRWWCELRDSMSQWLHTHAHLGLKEAGLAILDQLDGVAVRTKKTMDMLTIGAFAIDHRDQIHDIQTVEVSLDEALAQFPELRTSPLLIQEL